MAETSAASARSVRPGGLIVPLLLALSAIYLGACLYFYSKQDQMAFPAPGRYPHDNPSSVGVAFEDLHIPVNASEQIHAWWIPPPGSEKVLLFFHGNGYVIEQTVNGTDEVERFHKLDVNVLMFDYRGYGSSSPRQTNERRVYEDAEAAYKYLVQQRKVPAKDIVFVGRSIGSGPATEMAMLHPEAFRLILISPFTNVLEVARELPYLKYFPLGLLAHNRFDNLSKIASVRIPVFITVGSDDTLTPPPMTRAIYQKANQPKRLVEVSGAEHNEFDLGQPALQAQILEFLQLIH